MKLSVLCPAIRPINWERLFYSIEKSFSGDFELILISPLDLPEELRNEPRIKLIKSFASPMVCQQMALIEARGEYITWAADDGVFCDGALDLAFSKLDGDYKTVIMGKYIEGDQFGTSMLNNEYYILSNHKASNFSFIEPGRWMLNVGIVSKKVLEEVGGWDCEFEVCPMAFNDLSIRLQRYGCKYIIQDEIMFRCSHMGGTSGDHAPIHNAQIQHDEPLFWEKFRHNGHTRIKIDINNHEKQSKVWKRRFNI